MPNLKDWFPTGKTPDSATQINLSEDVRVDGQEDNETLELPRPMRVGGVEFPEINRKTQVLPFGLGPTAYANLLTQEYAGELEAKVVVLWNPQELYWGLRPDLEAAFRKRVIGATSQVVDLLDETPWSANGRANISVNFAEACPVLWEQMRVMQRAWTFKGVYVTAAFTPSDEYFATKVTSQIGNSGLLYDLLVERHGSIYCEDHQPLELGVRAIRDIRGFVGNVGETGLAYLPESLLPFRDKISIMIRAALMEKDPFFEYQSFLESGNANYLGVKQEESRHLKDVFVTDRGLLEAATELVNFKLED